MDPAHLPAIMGSILIVAGIAQVIVQMWKARMSRGRVPQAVNFDRSGFKIQTAYPGMTMICVGAFLLAIGGVTGGSSN